ncbi:MAG TPA: TIGR00730 family Rossman fold protein [Candidatus Limosilactobacillus faecipullorum]|nr:TIGR00730 family Rossman fold protein [Candidatus Limosilactobacillus faecipullorum]
MIKRIAVFCGAQAGKTADYQQLAHQLGQKLAQQQIELIYGGGGYGLMGTLANATLDAGGQVTGVITKELLDRGAQLERLEKLEVATNMDKRKERMIELADGFIALPGGLGTLEEISQVSAWTTIGDNQKPVAIYNYRHFYDDLANLLTKMSNQGFLEKQYLHAIAFATSLDEILSFMTNYQAPHFRSYQ